MLVEFYSQAAYKRSKSSSQTFWQDFENFFLQFLPISAKIVVPPNNLVQNDTGSLKVCFSPLKMP